jgi:hypothetical protein
MKLLARSIFVGTADFNNIAAVGGSSHVAAVESPHLVTMGTPVLGDVALVVLMTPKPEGFVVGTKFSDWAEHGFLHVDEGSQMSLPLWATVKAEQ